MAARDGVILTILGHYLVKDRNNQLLQGRGRRVVDNRILARLEDEANIQGGDEKLALDIGGVVGQQRRECLKDLELDIETG